MKNLFFSIFFTLLTVGASAQLSVSGKLRTVRPFVLTITDLAGNKIVECQVESNKPFKTKKVNIAPDLYLLKTGESEQFVLLNNNAVTLNGYIDDRKINMKALTTEGLESNQEIFSVFEEYKESKCSFKVVEKHLKTSKLPKFAYAALIYFNKDLVPMSFETFNDILQIIPLSERDKQVVKYLESMADKYSVFAIGASVADFTLVDKENRSVSLSSLKGKIVLLDFWASWCNPCRIEMKSLHKIYNEIKGDDLEFISISLDTDREKWLKSIEADNIQWLALWDKNGFDKSEFRNLFGFRSIPFIVVIDKDGKLAYRKLRGEDVRTAIQNLRKK